MAFTDEHGKEINSRCGARAACRNLEGEVLIGSDSPSGHVGTVGPGECLGEVSLLQQSPHSATATARTPVQAAVLSHSDVDKIARLRPDIGVVIYRNLAAGLGRKLTGHDRG